MRVHQSTTSNNSNSNKESAGNNNSSNGNSTNTTSVSSLAESLSQFGNVKNEFIVSGRIAAKNLIQERRFEEAIRVCEMVLAVDSEDIETVDMKERAIVYINNPDQFDLHQMQRDGILGAQRLLRSASERRVRKTDGGAIISSTAGFPSGSPAGKSPTKNTHPASASGSSNGTATNPPSSQPVKLRRTRSELHRPSNVLEKIKEFERQSKNPVNVNGTSTGQITRPPESVSTSTPVQSPPVPSTPPSPSSAPGFSYTKIIDKIKTEPLTPVAENCVAPQRRQVARVEQMQNGRSLIKWSDLGKAIDSNLKSQLETNLFASPLLKKACIISTKAEIWACFGWTYVRKVEFEVLLSGMRERTYLTGSKLRLDGTEFSCLSGTDTVVRARVQKLGVNCTKLNNLLVIAVYEHPVLPKEVAMLVKRVGEILAKNEERMILV